MGHDAILQVRADREITGDETSPVSNIIIGKYCDGADIAIFQNYLLLCSYVLCTEIYFPTTSQPAP